MDHTDWALGSLVGNETATVGNGQIAINTLLNVILVNKINQIIPPNLYESSAKLLIAYTIHSCIERAFSNFLGLIFIDTAY